jgi:outer membrane protein assembly factor BamB
VTPITGGIELSWDDVIAADLAGYQVYWRDSWFLDQQATGMQRLGSLEGQSRHMLILDTAEEVYIRISANDICGNESDLSEMVVAAPLPGAAPVLQLTAAAPSGMLNESIGLAATGADVYAWDLDGDGIYEVTDDLTGAQIADTSATGIIRPAVRGQIGTGSAVAQGSVSLLIAGNARPVANGYAEPSAGPAPLTVDFTGAGTDPDGEIVLYSWDFDGNGSYDWSSPTNSNPPDQVYNLPYLRNVKFRVDDDQGAYDVDTVALLILDPLPGPNTGPVADLSADKTASYWPFKITFDGSGSSDPDGSIALFEWDYNGDGVFDAYSSIAAATFTYPSHGFYLARLRVTDDRGAQDESSLLVTLPSEWSMFGMDAARTRCSPYTGAQTNNVKWSWTAPTELRGSPAIGADGMVYIGSLWPDNRLFAIRPDGVKHWHYNGLGEMVSSPAVGPDGTLYIGTSMSEIVAIGPGADNRWTHTTSDMVPASPAIGFDGDIYVGDLDGRMYALHPDGTLKWDYSIGGMFESSPAIAADGTVYVGNTDNNVYAFGPDGRPKGGNWPFVSGGTIDCSPAIGSDGTIYIGCNDHKFYAINPDGTKKWSYQTPGNIESSPAISQTGDIFFGCDDSKVYALNADGDPLGGSWPFDTGGYIESSPAIGADGTIYIGSDDDKVYAINPDGTELWSYTTGGDILSSPAIAADGTVYVGSDDGYLYAFGPPM